MCAPCACPIFLELRDLETQSSLDRVANCADFVLDVHDHPHLLRASELLAEAIDETVSICAASEALRRLTDRCARQRNPHAAEVRKELGS